MKHKKKAVLYLGVITFIFIGCSNSSPIDSLDQSFYEKEDLALNKLCSYPGETNCEDPPDDPPPPPPGDGGGLQFEADSFFFNNLYLQAIGISSTSEDVDYLSVEVKLYYSIYGPLYGTKKREAFNDNQIAASIDYHHHINHMDRFTLEATHVMEDGNIEETKTTYASYTHY